jgi:biotin carboxyl carrier protein
MRYVTTINNRVFIVDVEDECHVTIDGIPYEVDFNSVSDQPVYSLIVDGKSYEAYVYPTDEAWQVLIHGTLYPAVVEDEREKRLRAASGRITERGEYHLKAPMPGLIVAIPKAEGQKVEKGEVLVVLESMKMQNELRSPRAGTLSRVRVKVGDSVEQKQTLLSVV